MDRWEVDSKDISSKTNANARQKYSKMHCEVHCASSKYKCIIGERIYYISSLLICMSLSLLTCGSSLTSGPIVIYILYLHLHCFIEDCKIYIHNASTVYTMHSKKYLYDLHGVIGDSLTSKTPPAYALSDGPIIVACQWNMSSPKGPVRQESIVKIFINKVPTLALVPYSRGN
jgi:hypothetical protein